MNYVGIVEAAAEISFCSRKYFGKSGLLGRIMSLAYLKEALDAGDTDKLIRYVRLHFGDGNEQTG